MSFSHLQVLVEVLASTIAGEERCVHVRLKHRLDAFVAVA